MAFSRRHEARRRIGISEFKNLVLRWEADVENARRDFDQARMFLDVMKTSIYDTIHLLPDLNNAEQALAIWHLYWLTDISAEDLATELHEIFPGRWKKTWQAYLIAGPATATIVCGVCKSQYVIEVESRSALERCRAGPPEFNQCPECIRKIIADDQERLRTMPYQEYLQTVHWERKRQDALERAAFRCQVCNATNRLDVHHRTYERRGAEAPADLIVLCRECHEMFHANRKLAR